VVGASAQPAFHLATTVVTSPGLAVTVSLNPASVGRKGLGLPVRTAPPAAWSSTGRRRSRAGTARRPVREAGGARVPPGVELLAAHHLELDEVQWMGGRQPWC